MPTRLVQILADNEHSPVLISRQTPLLEDRVVDSSTVALSELFQFL